MNIQESKPKLKSVKDIELEVNNFIDKISKDETNTENSVGKLIEEMEGSFEDAKYQTEKNVLALNKKRTDLEKTVTTKFNSASESLKKSIDIFRKNYEGIKIEYRNSLFAPVCILIFMVFFYDIIVAYIPFIDVKVYEISIVKPLLVIFALIFVYISYMKFRNRFNNDSEILEETKTSIDKTEIAIEEVTISQQKFNDVKPFFKDAKGVIKTLVVNFGNSIPLVNQVFNLLTLLAKYGTIVKNFELALNYYGLIYDPKFFDDLGKNPPSDVQIIDNEKDWGNSIAEKIINKKNRTKLPVYREIILLLYNEHNGMDTTQIYRNILESDEKINNLAKILIESKRLVKPPENVIFNDMDIITVLKSVDSFDISKINNIISISLRQLDYLNSYIDFLDKNGVNPNFKADIQFIIKENENENSKFEYQVVKLAYKIGRKVFKIPNLNEDLIEGFARASISIKFHNEMSLKEEACKISANDRAGTVILAYYEKSKEIDRKDAVKLNELIEDLNLIKSLYEKKSDRDFRFLISQLKEGNWFDSSPALLKALIETMKVEIEERFDNIEKYTILQKVVTATFKKVKIDTVEKAIDAQVFGAYVIMFSVIGGNLAEKVAMLSKRNPDKRWNIRSSEEMERIEKSYGVKPKNDFISFSKNTRIGVLKKGESFLEFSNNFMKDLKKILSKTDEQFDIGVVIQRITPSKYSFAILDKEELTQNVDLRNLDVADFIARLASDHVPQEEQASVIKLEKDINLLEILNGYTIYDIIKVENDDIDEKEKNILELDSIKTEILVKLESSFGTKNLRELALMSTDMLG
jgi:hypothetical protein